MIKQIVLFYEKHIDKTHFIVINPYIAYSLYFSEKTTKRKSKKMTRLILTLKTQSKWLLPNITLSVDSISQSSS